MGVVKSTATIRFPCNPDRYGDETLHQVTLRWTNIRFVAGHPLLMQAPFQLHQLPILRAVQPQHGTMLKILERQWLTPGARKLIDVRQQRFHPGTALDGHEGHRLLLSPSLRTLP